MYQVPEPSLQELQEDAAAIEAIMPLASGPDQVLLTQHLRGLQNSISFIERMGR